MTATPHPNSTGGTATPAGGAGPDLRLAGTALGAWLAALWALHHSTAAAAGLAVGAGCLAALGWYARSRRPTAPGTRRLTATVLIGVLLGVASGAASTAARTASRDSDPLAGLVQRRATVLAELTVTDDPKRARSTASRIWLVPARLTRFRVDDSGNPPVRLAVRVLVLTRHPGWRGLVPGQRVTATARLAPSRGGDLRAAVLSVSVPPRPRGPAPAVQRAAQTFRDGLQRAAAPLPDDAGGLLPGLAIGDVSHLEPAVEEDFRSTGMTHLTAVSGSNVAIIVGFVLLVTAWCRAGPRTAAALSMLALAGFVILVRPSPSVLRASVMGGLALVALAFSRPRQAVPALAATVYLLVVVDPALAADPGFVLSVVATTGLLFLAPGWRDALRRRGVPRGVAEALAVPVAAQATCAPVIAGMTGTVSLSAIPANLLAAPAVAPATVLGAGAAVISPVWPGGAEFLAWLGSWPARWLVLVARWGAGLPGSTAPWPDGTSGALLLAVALTLLLLAARRRAVRRLVAVAAVASLIGVAGARTVAPGWPPPAWVFVACDVGQGDALVIRTGDGQAVVIDAGPAPGPVDRCLRRLEITTVPLLVLSHFHADHVGGLAGAVRGRRVAAVAGPSFDEPESGHATVVRALSGTSTPMLALTAGWRYQVGEVRIRVLGPDGIQLGTRSDSNNNSLILHVEVPGLTMLLTGDAEVERQEALLTSGEPLRADLLKIPHHGSAYQSRAFLRAVDPLVAVASVGADNDYGHPDSWLLRRLAADGARVYRTDRAGDVAVSRSFEGMLVTSRGRRPGNHPS